MSTSTSEALVQISDIILAKVAGLSTTEISKRGRKYRFVNNNFQRVREEDKHLVVNPECLRDHTSTVLAYNILGSILTGIFLSHRDLCLIIMGVARALEENHWYEEENSSVVHASLLNIAVDMDQAKCAVEFARGVTETHLAQGYNLLYCAKLNFLHTDHHVGSKLEGFNMRKYVEMYFGGDALESQVVLSALKSFSHWAHIKGLLYKLGVPHMDVDEPLKSRFSGFPDPPLELAEYVHARFPSGTSKYALMCKALDHVAQYKYARLVPYPQGLQFDCRWVYDLCDEITRDPARYHLRSKVKKLSLNPANLQELSQLRKESSEAILLIMSLVVNTLPGANSDFLIQNTRIPSFNDSLTSEYQKYYDNLLEIAKEIEDYENKGWAPEDIVLRMHKGHMTNFSDEIEKVRNGL